MAELYAELYGVRYDPEDMREFTSNLDTLDFWYRTPLEKNIALQQKLEAGRHQHAHKKSKFGDVAHMQFSAWDPNRYFDRIYPWLRWIYTPWFTTLCLTLFAFMAFVFVANWRQIGLDTLQFYSFTQKQPPIWPSSGFSSSSSATFMKRPTGSPASTTVARCTRWAFT